MISDHLPLEPLFLRAQQAQRQALQARKRKLARRARTKLARDNSGRDRRRSAHQQAGDRYEEAAWRLLERAGCQLLGRQLTCPLGELDLVVREGAQLVFIEVRQRSSTYFGGAAASVGGLKQRRIIFAARHYLMRLPELPPCRFDVVVLEFRHFIHLLVWGQKWRKAKKHVSLMARNT